MPKGTRSKYAPLSDYLASSGLVFIPMSFRDIENIIGCKLPQSASRYPTWWHSRSSNHVNAVAWLNVGYKPTEVDLKNKRVTFRKLSGIENIAGGRRRNTAKAGNPFLTIHGALRGTVSVAPGTDLTRPVRENLDATR